MHFRTEFDEFLLRFLAGNPDLFGGPFADTMAAVEFDMLTRPYVYRNTPLSSTSHLRRLLQEGERTAPLMEPAVIAIDHEPGQIYRIVRRTQKEYSDECRLFVLEMAITIRPGGTLPQQDISELAAPGVGAAGKADERRTSAP